MTDAVIEGLVADLAAEQGALAAVLAGRPDRDWEIATPAKGWDVRDQIAHLAHFDAITTLSIGDRAAFVRLRDGLPDLQKYIDGIGERNRTRSGVEMLALWQEESDGLRRAALSADPKARVPWFGPDMSLASKLTARIMETWAHGQDVVDALGARRPATDRLRHVARIGVLAFPNSFRVRGLEVPEATVFVCLELPGGGQPWVWGEAQAADRVVGSAEDFCLVVTQRRHLDDTRLEVAGPVASAWMQVAQAFAGPPGPGREPGQFAVTG